MTALTLGTRGSELALTQTRLTTAALHHVWPGLAVGHEVIKTIGDLRPDLKLADFSKGDQPVVDKGIFTKELEIALKAGTIHAAVHSLKDVPTVLDEGFRIVAVLPRAPIADVLISRLPGGMAGLPPGAVVATSSVRRACQLRALRPDLTVTDIRGNVPTRIRRIAADARVAALVLAHAGLERLGLFQATAEYEGVAMHMSVIPEDEMLPAASQGAVGIEIYGRNPALEKILAGINHAPTFIQVKAERRFLELLKAGCQTPVGVRTWLEGDQLHMKAIVFPDGGGTPLHALAQGMTSRPEEVAARLFAGLR